MVIFHFRNKFACALLKLVLALLARTALSTEPQQQDLFVAGRDGYDTYRIPSLIVATNGDLLAFCEGRKRSASDSGDIDLLCKRSMDGGKTWSAQEVLWDDGENTCGNPCVVVDESTGTIWLFATHNPGNKSEKDISAGKSAGARTVWVLSSKDNGKTWSPPKDITSTTKASGWGWYATGPGVGIQLKSGPRKGLLVIPCDHSYQTTNGSEIVASAEHGSHVIYSDDHGKSWKLGGTIRPKMNECQVVELADGAGGMLLSMRNYLNENRRAHSVSQDGGMTWNQAELDPGLIDPTCQASILRYSWPGPNSRGRLIFSNPASQRRQNLTVRVSYDDGKTWPISKSLFHGASAYCCLAVMPDQTIGCLYERGDGNAYQKLTFARLPLSWLEENE
jgi:sialidase-1